MGLLKDSTTFFQGVGSVSSASLIFIWLLELAERLNALTVWSLLNEVNIIDLRTFRSEFLFLSIVVGRRMRCQFLIILRWRCLLHSHFTQYIVYLSFVELLFPTWFLLNELRVFKIIHIIFKFGFLAILNLVQVIFKQLYRISQTQRFINFLNFLLFYLFLLLLF